MYCLFQLLQARATTGWLKDNEDFIALIQSTSAKYGATNFNQTSTVKKITGSCSAYGPLLDNLISVLLGWPVSSGGLISAFATKYFRPGKYTIFKLKLANFNNYLTCLLFILG